MSISSRIIVRSPWVKNPAAWARFEKRVNELCHDLGLDKPEIKGEKSGERIIVAGNEERPFLARRRLVGVRDDREPDEAEADAAAATVSRHRWLLLRAALEDVGVPDRPALRHAAEAGLTMAELETLHESARSDDDELLWHVAERHAPALELRHGPDVAEQLGSCAVEAAQHAADLLGFDVPTLQLVPDPCLAKTRFRLRLGYVREPIEVQPLIGDRDAMTAAIASAVWRLGPRLLNARALLSRLLNSKVVPPAYARQALQSQSILRTAEALRMLLSEGFFLVHPVLLCEALIAARKIGEIPVKRAAPKKAAKPVERRQKEDGDMLLLLPGSFNVSEEQPNERDRLAAYIRAVLAPASLRVYQNRTGSSPKVPILRLADSAIDVLRANGRPDGWDRRFAESVARTATDQWAVLWTPGDIRKKTRDILADRLPGVPVIANEDLPEGIGLMYRGKPVSVPPGVTS